MLMESLSPVLAPLWLTFFHYSLFSRRYFRIKDRLRDIIFYILFNDTCLQYMLLLCFFQSYGRFTDSVVLCTIQTDGN